MYICGYSIATKGYKFFSPATVKLIVSRDAVLMNGAIWNWSKEGGKTFIPELLEDENKK